MTSGIRPACRGIFPLFAESHCGPKYSGVACSAPQRPEGRGPGMRNRTRGGSVDHLCVFRNRLRRCDHRNPLVGVISAPRIYNGSCPACLPLRFTAETVALPEPTASGTSSCLRHPQSSILKTYPAFRGSKRRAPALPRGITRRFLSHFRGPGDLVSAHSVRRPR